MRGRGIWFYAIVISGLLSNIPSLAADPSNGSDKIAKFERIESISVSDFWSLAPVETYGSKFNVVIAYWPFDYDEIARVDGWRRIGLIAAGWYDLGETPIAAYVYAREGVYLLPDDSRRMAKSAKDEAFVVFGMTQESCMEYNPEACEQRVVFSINEKSEVFADGIIIGVVHD